MAAESKTKHYVNVFLRYFVLILVGLIMIYPLVWMVGATFKSNAEIFSSIGFIPKNPTLEGYKKAMESYGGAINVWKAMLNRKHHTAGYVPGRILHASEYAVFGLRAVLKPLCISFYPGAILFFSRLIIQKKYVPAKPVGTYRRTGSFLHHLLQLLLFRFRGQGIPCSASLQNHDRKLLKIMILCYIF